MTAKYVIIDVLGIEMPILLPPDIEHKCALAMGRPVSAGWCDPSAEWVAFGESLSLKLAARPEMDALLLRMYFGRLLRRPDDAPSDVDTNFEARPVGCAA